MDVRGGDVCRIRVRSAEAEDVQGGDGLGSLACAQDVADNAAQPGVGPGVRFNGGGVIVRFRLQADGQVVIQGDEAGHCRQTR